MADENLVDAFYTLSVSVDGVAFKKIKFLQKCDPVQQDKTLDDVTPTDAKRTVKAKVDFVEDSDLDFEYVLDAADTEHIALQAAFDNDTELTFQYKFTDAPSLSRQFKGQIIKLTPDASDKKKKIRMQGTINITSDPTPIVVGP